MTVNIEELNEQAMDTDFDSGYSSNREPTTTPEPDAGIPAEKIETPHARCTEVRSNNRSTII